MKKIYTYIIPVMILIGLSGCKDFFDINQDKNNPLDARLDQLLLTPEVMVFNSFGGGPGGLSDLTSQWVHQTVQRGPNNFYFMDGNEFNINNAWGNLYDGALIDLNIIIEKGTTQGANNYVGVAKLLKAYSYSMMIDIWGVAVFSEFGKGSENFFPHFDSGEDVYKAVFLLIDEAKADLGKTFPASLKIGAEDQIYNGNLDKWVRLCNSLKLKLYNQVRLTGLYNATDVAALLAEDNFIGGVSDGFRLMYNTSNTPENRHPIFAQDYANAPANDIDPYFFLMLKGDGSLNPLLTGISDPRMPYYLYNQLATGEAPQNKFAYKNGNFLSIWFASFNIDPNEGFDQGNSKTLYGLYSAGGPYDDGSGVNHKVTSGLQGAGFQRFYPYFSQLFTRAELALTKSTGEDDALLLNSAIAAAFAEVNEIATIAGAPLISDTNIAAYQTSIGNLYAAASAEKKLEILLTEKWIASFGFANDSYTDYRRTGYPIMFDPSTDNNPVTVLSRNYPVSFPLDAFDLKSNPNAPKDRNPGSTKIFWDVN